MADLQQQKIHPVAADAAAPTSVDVSSPRPRPRSSAVQHLRPPSPPEPHPKPPGRRSSRGCCSRCLCWSSCFLLLLAALVAAAAGILYAVLRPEVPRYSIDGLRIAAFGVDRGLNIDASFDVAVTATNPNKNIGIYYEDHSHLSVWHTGTRLCAGSLPAFYQGHRNTTVLNLVLAGRTQIGSDLLLVLRAQQQRGMVPLIFKGDVPVRLKLGSLKLSKVRFLVTCSMIVDSLSVNNRIRIRTSDCRFKLRL